MSNRYPIRFLFLLSIMALMSSCETDSDHDGVSDDRDRCPQVAGTRADHGCPVEPQIGRIHLYLDNSASMGGYYRGTSEFKTILADLAVKIDKEIRPVDISFIADRIKTYPGDVTSFTTAIATTPIAGVKSSELHRMIQRITSRNGASDVGILVTDGILSFPDSAIKKDREINARNAESTLKNYIYSTFADLNKEFSVSVYAFKSAFYGTYYTYEDQPIKLKGQTPRPFYVLVIAPKTLLGKFDTALEGINTFRPEKSLHFGLTDSVLTRYQVIPQLERQGRWAKSSDGLSDVELSQDQPLQAAIAVNLAQLPAYARDPAYLQQHLMVTANGCRATIEAKDKSTLDGAKIKNEKQIQAFEQCSHVLLLKVSQMPLSAATVNIRLPLAYDTWYRDWSTMDDRTPAGSTGKTFALTHLISGIQEAYETKNKNYINLTIHLSK